MKIVEFKEKDIDIVFEIQQKAYKPLYEKYHDDSTNPYMESKETVLQKYIAKGTKGYIFIKNDVATGTVRIILEAETKSAKISALAVLPQYQGQGISQQALLQIEQIHSEIEHWSLDTILEEKGNCHLYEKLGYKRTGKLQKINDKMTLVFYEK